MAAVVTFGPCFICRRTCDETSVNVDHGAVVVTVCGVCWEKRDEDYLEERLDMTEHDE